MSAVARARSLIGCPYRTHGRNPRHGLDCLGLVLWCFGLDGQNDGFRDSKDVSSESLVRTIRASFYGVPEPKTGDLIVMRRGRRWHFAIVDDDTIIHADARLKRVARRRGEMPWPLHSVWRPRTGNDDGNAYPSICR